ncbi:MAG: hypothetical protein WAK93_00550, partial [Solirubrobacteraceae bacterium]
MVSDEQLIESLRSSMRAAVADVYPPPDLVAAASKARRRLAWAPRMSVLVPTGAVLVTLVVAGLAIALLHGRGHDNQANSPATQAANTPDTIATLQSELAVLRRPQRRADHAPAWAITAEEHPHCSNCLTLDKINLRQTRLLTTIPLHQRSDRPGHLRVYLIVGSIPRGASGWRQHGPALTGVHVDLLVLPTRGHRLDQPLTPFNHGDQPLPAAALTPRNVVIGQTATVGVVPDGVSRVKWELSNPGQA